MDYKQTKKLEYAVFWTLLANLIIFSVVGFLGMFAWKQSNVFAFISSLFDMSHFFGNISIGILIAFIFLVLVRIANRKNLAPFPDNELTEPLREGAKKPFGPLFLGLCSGISEEWFFRAFILSVFAFWMHPLLAALLSSIVFMALHIPQYKGYPFIHVHIFLYSMAMSISFLTTETLWACMISHILYNTVLFHWIRNGKM